MRTTHPLQPPMWSTIRFRIEVAAAILFFLAAVLTLAEPTWLEWFTGTAPDDGSGSVEVSITVTLGVLALASTALARFEWRRALTAGKGG
jgi:hypothetical protein